MYGDAKAVERELTNYGVRHSVGRYGEPAFVQAEPPMSKGRNRLVSSRSAACLVLLIVAWSGPVMPRALPRGEVNLPTASGGNQVERSVRRSPDPTRRRFLEMFARAYFPGRTGHLM